MFKSRSDIPLHTKVSIVHKSGAIPTSLLQDIHWELPENNMHMSVMRSAAVRSTDRNLIIGKGKGKGKMQEQYADELDAEVTLLQHAERH